MKSKNAAILTSITLAVMLISTPAAFAQIATTDGHSTLFNPVGGMIPPGGTITAITGVQVPQALAISGPILYHIQDNFPPGVAIQATQILCQADGLSVPTSQLGFGAEDILSVLVDSADTGITAGVVNAPVGVHFPGATGVVQSVTYLVGPIGFNSPVISAVGTPSTYLGKLGLATPIVGFPVWLQTNGPNPGTFGIPNALDPMGSSSIIVSCGCVDQLPANPGTGDGFCVGENDGIVAESYQVKEIVGGGSLQISTIPLVVAGAESNALWILPILGLAGTIIAIRKLEA